MRKFDLGCFVAEQKFNAAQRSYNRLSRKIDKRLANLDDDDDEDDDDDIEEVENFEDDELDPIIVKEINSKIHDIENLKDTYPDDIRSAAVYLLAIDRHKDEIEELKTISKDEQMKIMQVSMFGLFHNSPIEPEIQYVMNEIARKRIPLKKKKMGYIYDVFYGKIDPLNGADTISLKAEDIIALVENPNRYADFMKMVGEIATKTRQDMDAKILAEAEAEQQKQKEEIPEVVETVDNTTDDLKSEINQLKNAMSQMQALMQNMMKMQQQPVQQPVQQSQPIHPFYYGGGTGYRPPMMSQPFQMQQQPVQQPIVQTAVVPEQSVAPVVQAVQTAEPAVPAVDKLTTEVSKPKTGNAADKAAKAAKGKK